MLRNTTPTASAPEEKLIWRVNIKTGIETSKIIDFPFCYTVFCKFDRSDVCITYLQLNTLAETFSATLYLFTAYKT